MSGVTGAIIGGAVVTAGASVYSSRQASNATGSAASSATAENSRQFDTVRADTAAQRQLGQGATGLLSRLYGLPAYSEAGARAQAPVVMGDTELPPGTMAVSPGNKSGSDITLNGQVIGRVVPGGANGRFLPAAGVDINALWAQQTQQPGATPATNAATGPDLSGFFESPDYRFNLGESEKALDRSLLARGRGISGAGVKEGVRLASGAASGEFGNFFNRLTTLAGIGSAATNTSAQAGLTTAANNSNIITNAGNQRASAYVQGAAGVNNSVQGGLSNWLLMNQMNKA
jgi:hypothetical protein